MNRILSLFFLLWAVRATAAAKPQLFQQPALSATQIVFNYAGDLWAVARDGGDARRLTSAPGLEGNPCFSPDGRWIAFTGEYDGSVDAFLIPSAGGIPRRLTWHPGTDTALGWTREGKSILLRSGRNSYSRFNRLFTLPVDGVFPQELPLPMAEEGSFSPDSTQIAYVPLSRPFNTWKRYRGGRTTSIWIARLSDSSVADRIPRDNSNDFNPMWIDQRIYFLSDRSGPTTLFSYDTKTKKVRQEIANTGFDIKSASAGPGAIAYEQIGGICLFDLKTQKSKRVEITLNGDMPEVRPRFEKVANRIQTSMISPTGTRALFEARGEIFTVPAEKGDVRDITNTPGAAERDPVWSPDGKWIAYFSDASGEYELHVKDQSGKEEAKKYRLSDPPTFYYTPTWSPDSRKIAFTDKKLNLSCLDIESGKVTKVDTDRFDSPRRIAHIAWSPDSRWIAYTKQLRNTLRAAFINSTETGNSRQITDGMSDVTSPIFDADGKYLFLLASTDMGLNIGWRDMSAYFRPVTQNVYVIVLTKDLPSPLSPESDEEKPADTAKDAAAQKEKERKDPSEQKPANKSTEKKPPQVKIDFEGITNRILALPIPARGYTELITQKAGILYLLDAPFAVGAQDSSGRVLYKFELKTRKTEKILDDIRVFGLSANGEKMLVRQADRWFITATAQPPKPGEGTLKLDGMEVRVEPRIEWRQIYLEAWRIQRDFFYDPNLHGLDLKAMMKRYEPFLDVVESRSDLNYLMADMMGEFTASHLNVGGGAMPEIRRVRGGLLGADYRIENGRYRFAHVYSGESWNPDLRAPLAQPGVNVVDGEYLLAVNGRELRSSDNIYSDFEGTAGKQVVLRVGPNPDGSGARDVTVLPVDSEMRLRNLAWIEGNRRKVDQMSGGQLAYVYLPDTAYGGYTNFNRYYFAQAGKDGAVMDERFNGGGSQPDYIIDYLRRPLLHYRTTRDGEDFTGPLGAIFGPKVMLINEYAGSGGDTMPWYFRRTAIGSLIGKRTWGGLVGGLGGSPGFVDGGFVSPPSVGFWDPAKNEWVAENVGIAPDIEIEQDPKAMREGHDPQLEKAVEVLMEELKKSPPPVHKRPPFPNYHKK